MNLNKLGKYLLGGTIALLLMAANAAAQVAVVEVVVNTVGGDGTFQFTAIYGYTASLTTSGGTGQTQYYEDPGSVNSLAETVPAGWTLTSSSCTNGTPASFTAPATCTFNNTMAPVTGSITVVKNTVGGNGTFPFSSNFGLASPLTTVGGTVSQTVTGLAPGSAYNLIETTLPAGWVQTSATCNNGTTGAITVVAGATTTCTFTNTLPPGSITVVKNTVGADGTFTFTSNFGVTGLTTSGNTTSQTVTGLTAGGSYSISETPVSGWTLTDTVCTNGYPTAITVVSGATTTCTFTNVQQGSITVVKNTVTGNGTFPFSSDFGLTSLTTSGNTASQTFPNLTASNLSLRARGPSPKGGEGYYVLETVPVGWIQTGATCTNGTPANVLVAPGGTTTCTFTNAQTGSITVVKNTASGNGTFAFTSNFGVASLTTTAGTASQTVNNLIVGSSYSISEILPVGWAQTSATCTNGTPAAITVATGLTTTCTFTNAPAGSITVVDNTVGGNGTFAFASNFGVASLTTTAGTASQTVNNLIVGSSYSISEILPAGWAQTSATCTNGTLAAITVAPGATTTCTFTNAPAGSITVVDNTVGGNGTFAFTSNFGLTSLTTLGNTASQTFSGLTPGGAYSVSETVPAGWTQTSATCTSGTPAAVTVTASATTTCTFNNTLQQGSITVVKNTLGRNGTFGFHSNFGLTSLTTVGGTASQTFNGLTPGGAYSVSEKAAAGWTQTSATCTNGTPAAITVVAGVTTICTITNSKTTVSPPPPPTVGLITIVKNTVGGNGTFAFTSNFGLSSLTTVGGTASESFNSLAPGASFSMSETVPAGWTQTSATCTNGTPAAITVVAGQTTICIITNTTTTTAPPPAVTSTFPANGATLVTISANVVANFGALLNPLTMGTVNFGLWQGTTPVPGTVTYAGTFATFSPASSLAPHTQYTAVITNTAARAQAASYQWSFTTGSSADQPAVCLANFAILSGGSIFSSGPTTVTGDIGVSPGVAISGFPPGTLTGTMYAGDAAAAQGIIDLTAAYGNAVSRSVGAVPVAGDLGGQTFTAGLYNSVSSLSIVSGNLTLDAKGDPNAVFIFQMASTLTTAAGSQIILVGGASASNVFWQVGTSATLGGNSIFNGSILANQSITLDPYASVNGRLLAQDGEVTLESNVITSPPPAISVGGIYNAASGTQSMVAGGIVSVFGHNLGSLPLAAAGYPLPTTLGGSSFEVGTQAAPLYMTSCSQVNLQIPWEAVGQVPVTATVGGLVSTVETITVAPFAPGIFSLGQTGSGQGAVEIAATGELAAPLADAGVPVKRGQYIAIFGTGLGAVSNQPATGAAALSDPLSTTLTTPIVTIGGAAAKVTYSGLAPGFAGLYQVNALVPDDAPLGNSVNLVISIGGVQSNTVTIAVQ